MAQEHKSLPLRVMADVILNLDQPVSDARGNPVSSNGTVLTYATLASTALLTPYEGEAVPYQTKIARTELAAKILSSSHVKLRFADCIALMSMVADSSPAPIVAYRFSKLIEDAMVAAVIEQYRVERAQEEARNAEAPPTLSIVSTPKDAPESAS